jgi:uncharacterized protein (DUF2252 family)
MRNAKMARSSHAYVRGNTLKFYEWLEDGDRSAVLAGPDIWICGDCHVGNLGPVADPTGKVEIQIRDFDQVVIGNPAHDLIRLGLSLATAVRSSNLPGVTSAVMVEQLIEGYEAAFIPRRKNVALSSPGPVEESMREALRRSWRHLAKERLSGKTVKLPIGKRFWPLSKAEWSAVENLFHQDALHHLATVLKHREDEASVDLLDAAYWMKGCSSLGLLRMAVLLDVDRGATQGKDLCLIDIKEAVTAAAPRSKDGKMPKDNAERIVQGASALSPALGERMVAAKLLDRSVFVRELLPQDLKLEIDLLTPKQASKVAYYLANVVGKAHARQMDGQTRSAWQRELAQHRSKTFDVPSWLWSSIVDLVAFHERGYLEHCRRHALGARIGTRV